MRFYRCNTCNEVAILENSKEIKCCDEVMEELFQSTSGDELKHKPIINKLGNLVTVVVGEELHSMVDVHYIDFVVVETNKGFYYKKLEKNKKPIVDFLVHNEEEVLNVYSYCNNHGLWLNNEINYLDKPQEEKQEELENELN